MRIWIDQATLELSLKEVVDFAQPRVPLIYINPPR